MQVGNSLTVQRCDFYDILLMTFLTIVVFLLVPPSEFTISSGSGHNILARNHHHLPIGSFDLVCTATDPTKLNLHSEGPKAADAYDSIPIDDQVSSNPSTVPSDTPSPDPNTAPSDTPSPSPTTSPSLKPTLDRPSSVPNPDPISSNASNVLPTIVHLQSDGESDNPDLQSPTDPPWKDFDFSLRDDNGEPQLDVNGEPITAIPRNNHSLKERVSLARLDADGEQKRMRAVEIINDFDISPENEKDRWKIIKNLGYRVVYDSSVQHNRLNNGKRIN